MRKPQIRAIASVLAGVNIIAAAALASPAASAERPFTFRQNEYAAPDLRLPAARDFVARRLPAGLPLAEARARAAAANLDCGKPAAPGAPLVCRFAMLEATDGDTLGESVWTLRLTPDADGRLESASVEHAGPSL